MLKKIGIAIAGILVTLAVAAIAIYIATGPQRPSSDSSSAAWLEPGPYRVGQAEFVFVDESRSTDENRGIPGKPDRTLPSTIWYPVDSEGSHPLIVHSHGIVSSRSEMPYLMEQLASLGYVVVAADYPLTSGSTEGGANANDVINQPGDISFLIDSVLALAGDSKPFAGEIDVNRIGLSGYSLGGLTAILATYHPQLRDPRISATVAIAGPSAAFSPRFFRSSKVPFLAIAGTADALIESDRNAADIPSRVSNSSTIIIEGGSHLGFVGAADPTFRFMRNPDTLGCAAVMAVLGDDPNDVFNELGDPSDGIDLNRDLPGICDSDTYAETAHPGRQHMITQIAATSFFESVFSQDADRRNAAANQLSQSLAAEFVEASFLD